MSQMSGSDVNISMFEERCLNDDYDNLIRPIEKWLPDTNCGLAIVSDGIVGAVPFAALKNQQGQYLSQIYHLWFVPSVFCLRPQLGNTNEMRDGINCSRALVAAPGFAPESNSQPMRSSALPNSIYEANCVGSYCTCTPFVGNAATKEQLVLLMPQVDIIHIATHGGYPDDQVLLKFPCPDTTDAKPCDLSGNEVEAMKLRAKLVILSCCGTALGSLQYDGVMGLARSFLIAGAQAVVVTLWSIGDATTRRLMSFLYWNLHRGMTLAVALQKAMHQLRAVTNVCSPYFWAGFVVIGNGNIILKFPQKPQHSLHHSCCDYFAGSEEAMANLQAWKEGKDKDKVKVYIALSCAPLRCIVNINVFLVVDY